MKNTIMLSMLVSILVIASITAVSADAGAIWTTKNDCGDSTQDANQYARGEKLYINAANLEPSTVYNWSITGLGGSENAGASCDPSIVVANGIYSTNSSGAICFEAYTIALDDCGEYSVDYDGKKDNYRVDENLPVVPEFGTMVGILTALGAVGTFFLVRRK